MAGDKQILELSICKKNYAKAGDEATFTWVNVTVWQPPAWMATKAVKGAFVAGSGEFTLRTYESNGVKKQSADVRATSFDIEIGGEAGEASEQAPEPAKVQHRHVPAPSPTADTEAELPF